MTNHNVNIVKIRYKTMNPVNNAIEDKVFYGVCEGSLLLNSESSKSLDIVVKNLAAERNTRTCVTTNLPSEKDINSVIDDLNKYSITKTYTLEQLSALEEEHFKKSYTSQVLSRDARIKRRNDQEEDDGRASAYRRSQEAKTKNNDRSNWIIGGTWYRF